MNKKSLIKICIISIVILLIPLIAMQFTDEVDWGWFDFIVAAILLSSVGFSFNYIVRKVNSRKYRIVLIIFLIILFILIWAELGVGIFGTPFAGN